MSTPPERDLIISASRHATAWMAEHRVSLGFSTYQAGKLFLIGLNPDGKLSIYERTFNRCMGLYASPDAQQLWMASLYQLWRMDNYVPAGGQTPDGYDALYVPTVGYTTGDIDTHDIGMRADGSPIFAATLFNCLATTSPGYSLKPIWKPPFISKLVPEDRCHLNGLACEPSSGEPAYVTAVSRSDVSDGWRDRRTGGGIVMDVRTDEVVAEGLSMPHSPRLHPEFPGRVWLLNAGTGFFGYIDTAGGDGTFHEVAFCPGFGRGMAFVGRYAIVGLSAARENRTFSGMPLDENLGSRDAEPRCALHIISLDTGSTEHWIRIEGVVRELYDVIALNGVQRPKLLGFKTEEIHRMLRLDTDQ
ncbi:MAG TPA: TIGR03032 family protein [Phycisphaerales bacterium]|nr:TIGR03032 family protein [Phycisphaerales bacterium]